MPLNFAHPRPPVLQRLALAAAVTIIVSLVVQFQELNQRLDAVETHNTGMGGTESRNHALSGAGAAASQITAKLTSAQSVVRRIALPWDTLFEALGTAADRDVNLLELQPHAADGTLLLTAEARDVAAMLAYIGRLQAAAGIHEVFPLHHESESAPSQYPIRFTLMAKWKMAP
jgi:hypothetical protein